MTFKAGDIAIVVGAHKETQHIGKIVTLREKFFSFFHQCDGWRVDIDVGAYAGIAEKHLRPIRDQPGEGETLTWAPVPHNETV
jgi:hypothetical protein